MDNANELERTKQRGQGIGRWALVFVVGVVCFIIGSLVPYPGPPDAPPAPVQDPGTNRVTGLGGVFFRSLDPETLRNWYRANLGIDFEDWGGFVFQWLEKGQPTETGYTVWGVFPEATDYFSPSEESFMLNYRVSDMASLISALRDAGVEIVGEIEEHPNGKFAWILDPEGRKIELWEPIASAEDPYLQ